MKCLALVLFAVCVHSALSLSKLKTKYEWKEVEYAWPSQDAKAAAIASGRYKPENNLPLGLDIWKNKLFITVPRWKSGVASSLNYVDISNKESSILIPYPNWEANTIESDVSASDKTAAGRLNAAQATIIEGPLQNNATIISTFRIQVDECDRLWVMDTGLADILGSPKQIAPPALVIFDLKTDSLIKRYTFKPSDIKGDTFFANVIVDIPKHQCENAYAYIPDLGAYGVVVYSYKEDKSWRVKHNYFHFDPVNGDYNVGGVNFQWTDGVFGMALGRQSNEGARNVYFHALSSTSEFCVPNYVLQNETRALRADSYKDYTLIGNRGAQGQSTAEFFDETSNVLFYTQVNKDAVYCWNANKAYTSDNLGLVDSDSNALIFPNDLKIDREGNLWVLSDRMPIFIYSQLDSTQVNYRIMNAKVSDLISGTACEST